MKLGLGLYPHIFTRENFRFARQLGVTHIVAHLPSTEMMPSATGGVWSEDDLNRLRAAVEEEGLTLEAIENFPPAHWDQILLDGPRRDEQMENLKTTIRNMGRAGIPIMGYHFSLAGVWGRVRRKRILGGPTRRAARWLVRRVQMGLPLWMSRHKGRRSFVYQTTGERSPPVPLGRVRRLRGAAPRRMNR